MRATCGLALLQALGVTASAAPSSVCDIFAAAGTPCVAAHSTTRALYAAYSGPLYQVMRNFGAPNNATFDVPLLAPGGAANAAAQDAFCGASPCYIFRIYDQSPMANHLDLGPPGGEWKHADLPVNATADAVTVGGSRAYGAYFETKMGYRNDATRGVATGNEEETLYMVTSGTHVNGGCCFDYGNAELNNHDNGRGTMEAVYFGTSTGWGKGQGQGPWVMADLEDGLWAGADKVNNNNTPVTTPFVTAMVKGGANGFALKAQDATAGKLQTMWDGPRPAGYQPMKKEGAIILGIGGDNSDSAIGTFYEGVITQGYTTDAADDAVQANIVAAGYAL